MSQQKIGPREQMLRDMREDKLHSVPEFLSRIDALRVSLIKKSARPAIRPKKAKGAPLPDPSRNLTARDKEVIAELKKAGADKVSVVRKHGAKLKSETAKASTPKPNKPKASAPANQQETTMTTKTTKTTKSAKKPAPKTGGRKASPKKAAQPATKPATAAKPKAGGIRPGSKLELIAGLLMRPEGCTTEDCLKATGWPALSMPQQAKAAGLTLRKEKTKGEATRYWGALAA